MQAHLDESDEEHGKFSMTHVAQCSCFALGCLHSAVGSDGLSAPVQSSVLVVPCVAHLGVDGLPHPLLSGNRS